MGLRTKFNTVLGLVFLFGLTVSGISSYVLLQQQAREQVIHSAGIMMEAALAIRKYTVNRVKPNLEMQLMRTFLPESVPAFAATETFNILTAKYPQYTYKEATLNPTNPRDKADAFEAEIVGKFRSQEDLKDYIGERETKDGKMLIMAKPIKISDEGCLTCHSTPAAAPKTLRTQYGDENGFGWKLNETIGAQIVSLPMSVPIGDARRAFYLFLLSLTAVFVVTFIALNVMLSFIVVRPIRKLSNIADEISTGNLAIPEFSGKGKDEVSVLANSFNRMRRSLEKAMKLLEG